MYNSVVRHLIHFIAVELFHVVKGIVSILKLFEATFNKPNLLKLPKLMCYHQIELDIVKSVISRVAKQHHRYHQWHRQPLSGMQHSMTDRAGNKNAEQQIKQEGDQSATWGGCRTNL